MRIIFFKRPRPRQFDYKPRYYDPKKDELEQRKRELGITNSNDPSEKLRADIQRKWRYERNKRRSNTSEIKTIIYLIIAGLMIYLIFFTDFVNNFAKVFTR
jgi:hypothetical protein